MVEVKVYSGGSVGSKPIDESVFGERLLRRTMKDAVVMYQANARAGTAKTKTRGEVKGPNRKMWKQKHTGRARMGTPKASQWRGGGVVFGPRPRDYSYHMPAKARRAALRSAVLSKFRDNEVAVADGWPAEAPSTKTAAAILKALEMTESVLVVSEAHDPTLHMSLRNVPRVDVRPVCDLNAHQVLLRRYLVVTPKALEMLIERFGASAAGAAGASSKGNED